MNEKPNFKTLMTEQEFKEKLDTIAHRYAVMYPFAILLKDFKDLELITPQDFAHDITVIRDFVTSHVEFK